MATITPVTKASPREAIQAELARENAAAKSLKPSPAWVIAHERINLLLDWLVGR